MRTALMAAAAALLVVACVDFGLEDRRYRCDQDPDICGDGWSCVSGFCEPASSGGPDASGETGSLACEDAGDDVCDDENACTEDECGDDGECLHQALPDNTPCGEGCLCKDGEPTEVRDCPEGCSNQQTCCSDGTCRPSC